VNFGVAEPALSVVENEGNAWLTVGVPEIHVAIMGSRISHAWLTCLCS
jgi:L-lactate utilization protein LutB